MRLLADGLWQLRGFPPNAINVYLMGDVLVDAAGKRDRKRILRQLEGRDVSTHALTHVHPDHQGSSHAVCEELGIPLWCGADDADAMESGIPKPDHPLALLSWRLFTGPPHPVERRLREGDSVAGFTVFETPGHTQGHVAYWRASDRTLVLGDVLFGMHPLTGRPQLREPPAVFTPDVASNRQAIRRLAELEPALVCFGHGPPLRDPRKLAQFAAGLPR